MYFILFWNSFHRFLGLGQAGAVLWFGGRGVWNLVPVGNATNNYFTVMNSRRKIPVSSLDPEEKSPRGGGHGWGKGGRRTFIKRPVEPVQLQWCSLWAVDAAFLLISLRTSRRAGGSCSRSSGSILYAHLSHTCVSIRVLTLSMFMLKWIWCLSPSP